VESRHGRAKASSSAKEREVNGSNHLPPCPATHSCKPKYGSVELLTDARGHWPRIRGARLSGQVRRGGCHRSTWRQGKLSRPDDHQIPDGISLTCLQLTLTALNLSKTAYASFALDAQSFFITYTFNASSPSSSGDRFTCQLYNRALQSVFKGRTNDTRGRETGIDRCDVSIQDRLDKAECRLVVKMLCKHGGQTLPVTRNAR
jgi:hypothetical protein